jgi:hypothetical protein
MVLSHGANVPVLLFVVRESKSDFLITVPVGILVSVLKILFVDLLLKRKFDSVMLVVFVVNLLNNRKPLLVRL